MRSEGDARKWTFDRNESVINAATTAAAGEGVPVAERTTRECEAKGASAVGSRSVLPRNEADAMPGSLHPVIESLYGSNFMACLMKENGFQFSGATAHERLSLSSFCMSRGMPFAAVPLHSSENLTQQARREERRLPPPVCVSY